MPFIFNFDFEFERDEDERKQQQIFIYNTFKYSYFFTSNFTMLMFAKANDQEKAVCIFKYACNIFFFQKYHSKIYFSIHFKLRTPFFSCHNDKENAYYLCIVA